MRMCPCDVLMMMTTMMMQGPCLPFFWWLGLEPQSGNVRCSWWLMVDGRRRTSFCIKCLHVDFHTFSAKFSHFHGGWISSHFQPKSSHFKPKFSHFQSTLSLLQPNSAIFKILLEMAGCGLKWLNLAECGSISGCSGGGWVWLSMVSVAAAGCKRARPHSATKRQPFSTNFSCFGSICLEARISHFQPLAWCVCYNRTSKDRVFSATTCHKEIFTNISKCAKTFVQKCKN